MQHILGLVPDTIWHPTNHLPPIWNDLFYWLECLPGVISWNKRKRERKSEKNVCERGNIFWLPEVSKSLFVCLFAFFLRDLSYCHDMPNGGGACAPRHIFWVVIIVRLVDSYFIFCAPLKKRAIVISFSGLRRRCKSTLLSCVDGTWVHFIISNYCCAYWSLSAMLYEVECQYFMGNLGLKIDLLTTGNEFLGGGRFHTLERFGRIKRPPWFSMILLWPTCAMEKLTFFLIQQLRQQIQSFTTSIEIKD